MSHLNNSISLAEANQFAAHGYSDRQEAETAVDKLLETLDAIERKFAQELRS
jgi:hypothetical protein